MKLNEAKENLSYFINDIFTDENTRRRLESLSVIKGVTIKVIFQHNSGTVIQVGDTRLALDKMVTSKIEIDCINESSLKETLTTSLDSVNESKEENNA